VLTVLVGAALRLYPITCPYQGIELQQGFPQAAILALVNQDWKPFALHHGSGFLYVLRALYTIWYAIAHAAGTYHDRLDLLASYVRDPFPFVLTGRIVVVGASIATLVLVGRLGSGLFSPAAGSIAGLLLAVSFTHVRESHQVWLDVPASTLAVATVMAGLRAVRRAGPGLWVAGALGGATLACKHSASPILPTVVIVAVAAGPRTRAAVGRRLVIAAVAGLAAYALLSPYGLLHPLDTLAALRTQASLSYGQAHGLSLGQLVDVDLGPMVPALALLGLVASARQTPLITAIVATFPVVFLLMIMPANLLYARYLAMVAPFVALYAGQGTALVGRLLTPRRPAVATIALALLAAAGPLTQSLGYVRLLGRADTRALAGEWIAAHVPPGTPVTLPDVVAFPDPLLPPDARRLSVLFPPFADALRARGLGDPRQTWPTAYLSVFGAPLPRFRPTPVVAIAEHPVVLRAMNPPAGFVQRLRAMGGRAVVEFRGVPEPLPASVVYDPRDADYLPLRGAWHVLRPGPTITIWELPAR
jgi:hypothetical protein